MVLTSVISTLMVLYCGLDMDFLGFWDTSGTLNDPTGDKHTMDLKTIVAEGQNFKSAQVASWASLGLETVRISAASVYGDIWWTTEFNATSVGPLLHTWAVGGVNILDSTSTDIASTLDTVYNTSDPSNYRFIVYPAYIVTMPLMYAWFAVTVSPMLYPGTPMAFIAKDPSIPFQLPVIVDGYLGCFPNSVITNLTFTKTDASASYERCRTNCSTEFDAVIMKQSTECYCGIVGSSPTGHDGVYCFLDCPGNNAQKCGGFDSNWQSVYHLPGPDSPGSSSSETIVFTKSYSNNITIEIDIAELQLTTADPAFISGISVTATLAPITYQIFYSSEPCASNKLQQLTTKPNNWTDFAADSTHVDVDMILVRCLRLVMSSLASTAHVKLVGPTNTDHISAPVIAIQGVKTADVTTTTTTPPTTTTTTPSTTTTSTTTATTTTTTTTTSTTTPTTTTTTTTTTPSTSTSTSTSTTTPSTTTSTTPAPTTVTSTTSSTTSVTPAVTTTTQPVGATTTDTTSSVQTTESTTASSTTSSCSCNCNDIKSHTNMTAEQLQEKIRALQKHLAVNTTSLSSYIRAKTSAQDNRPSAVSIGALGAGLLIAVFGLVLIIDSTILFKDLRMLTRNIRGFFTD